MRDGITLRVIVFTKEPLFRCFMLSSYETAFVCLQSKLAIMRYPQVSVCKNVFDANLFGSR